MSFGAKDGIFFLSVATMPAQHESPARSPLPMAKTIPLADWIAPALKSSSPSLRRNPPNWPWIFANSASGGGAKFSSIVRLPPEGRFE